MKQRRRNEFGEIGDYRHCTICNKRVWRSPIKIKTNKHSFFCSNKCKAKWQKTFYEGKNNPHWKNGTMATQGYRLIQRNGNQVYEHRWIMEQHLGRKLDHDEIVHHKDHNRTNNNIDNLQIMSNKEHTTFHQREIHLRIVAQEP